jgi:hypothetical protein
MRAEAVRRIVGSLDELLAGATAREPMAKPGDSRSGSSFERVVIDGERFVLKHLHVDDDWIQRVLGDLVCMPVRVWSSGLLDPVGHIIDDAIVGCVTGLGRNGWGAAILLRDVTEWFVPEGNGPLPWDTHRRFLEHMAEMHAIYWDFVDDVGLVPMGNRYRITTPLTTQVESEIRDVIDPVPSMLPDGWRRFTESAPHATPIVQPLHDDPTPITDVLERLPQTLVHSDWKLGNLGALPDGRTLLVDWAWPGRAPATVDLAWYVAVNCDRLPVPKEDAITHYRDALESFGVRTAEWWNAAFATSMLGCLVQMGFSKSGDELAWWDERAPQWARYL